MANHPELRQANDGVVLAVHVLPGARTTGIAGRHGDALKLRVTARPIDGRANGAVIDFLAQAFGLAPRDIEIISGTSSRQKAIRLGCLTLAQAGRKVDRLLDRT